MMRGKPPGHGKGTSIIPKLKCLFGIVLVLFFLSSQTHAQASHSAEAGLRELDFTGVVEEYSKFILTPYNIDRLALFIKAINQGIDKISLAEEPESFPPNLKLIHSTLSKTHALLTQASPDDEVQKTLIGFFDKTYHDRLGIQYVYAQRTFTGLQEASERGEQDKIQSLAAILSEVGTPDFQDRLWRIAQGTRDREIKGLLLKTLGKIGNQKAARLVYESLKTSPDRIYLDALKDLGLPDFKNKQEKPRVSGKHLLRKETPVKDLNKFYRDFKKFCDDLERAFSKLNLSEEEKLHYRRAIIQTRGQRKKDREYSFSYRGIDFREGDILMSIGTDPIGRFWGIMTNYPIGFSHFTMVTFTDDGFPLIAEIGYHMKYTHLENALSLFGDFIVLRYKDMDAALRERINKAVNQYYRVREQTTFDGKFDLRTDLLFYCGEFAFRVYRRAQVPVRWVFSQFPTTFSRENMARMGIKQEYLITHGDFLRMPEFSIIGYVYDKAIHDRITGKILTDLYITKVKTKHIVFSRIPGKFKYWLIATLLRLTNARGSKSFHKNMEFSLVTFFLSFEKIYEAAVKRASAEGLSLVHYIQFQERMKKIMEEESRAFLEAVFQE